MLEIVLIVSLKILVFILLIENVSSKDFFEKNLNQIEDVWDVIDSSQNEISNENIYKTGIESTVEIVRSADEAHRDTPDEDGDYLRISTAAEQVEMPPKESETDDPEPIPKKPEEISKKLKLDDFLPLCDFFNIVLKIFI